jgi:hypothetical protein
MGSKSVGMGRAKAIVSDAAALLGTPYPRDRDERWDALLAATGRDPGELRELFREQLQDAGEEGQRTTKMYIAFGQATKALPFDLLNEELWDCATNDNGGFQRAATAYAALSCRRT